jgi:hypothetical protein
LGHRLVSIPRAWLENQDYPNQDQPDETEGQKDDQWNGEPAIRQHIA